MQRFFLLVPAAALAVGLANWSGLPRPASGATRSREAAATPAGYVYVPAGWCWIGSDDPDADDDLRPRRRVFVGSFYVGKHEVTHAEWKEVYPEHVIPSGFGRHPVTNVLRAEAETYCRAVGGRLPTEREWEKAARGTDGRRYPWGDRFEAARTNLFRSGKRPVGACWVGKRGLKPVEAFPEGASPYGALQMAGNAWEWVSGSVDGDPRKGIIRGGAVGYGERAARTYQRAIEGSGVT